MIDLTLLDFNASSHASWCFFLMCALLFRSHTRLSESSRVERKYNTIALLHSAEMQKSPVNSA